MKKVLISSFDLEIGGVERSLINLLHELNYEKLQIDLMLYRHQGDFFHLLPASPRLLPERYEYRSFRQSIGELLKSGHWLFALTRILAKVEASTYRSVESGYKQMQYMWRNARVLLPKCKESYDVAVSYLWPHDFVAFKVQADKKVAWVHTDFETVDTDVSCDLNVWKRFDFIIAVSEDCRSAFISKYPTLATKVHVCENIVSKKVITELAKEAISGDMIRDSRFKMVTVARLSHAKGIDRAIKVLSELRHKGYDFAWYVVGYGGDEVQLHELIQQYRMEDSFFLIGKKLNPYPYIKAADLYVQPSRYEGKAVTVTEAQILGKPVLITNYRTARSQVNEGVDGIICNQSVEGITFEIIKLYENRRLMHSLSEACLQNRYDYSDEMDKLYKLLGVEV
ncbi:glycosyltransferase [Halalkalibacter sp. APA_J-10(15)]|uniref:glycosyltransferase n=1 Tax=unclassified Halalkalibacter TaxID=2893063 RepID=UPI001FF43199|nr:glycosyltransferase [Halalkalibacter sp. APA_J-10(15)]MCK0470348.1 glycosyltransferase [Halalkalibacter sp. APA_J-10(15)]